MTRTLISCAIKFLIENPIIVPSASKKPAKNVIYARRSSFRVFRNGFKTLSAFG